MATSTATRPPSATPKMQPPPPPRIRTSSVGPTSSSSPSLSSKRPPSLPRQPSSAAPTSATATGRPQRNRKETQRLRSTSSMPQDGTSGAGGSGDTAKPPLVRDAKYILEKFKGHRPSLIVHLHQTYFRFDQQDGSFNYQSPMKIFLEHLRSKTIPHDVLEELFGLSVVFYDGCLIVEVHDHRSTTKPTGDRSKEKSDKPQQKAFSMHNSSNYVTPSPYAEHVPYPSPQSTPQNSPPQPKLKDDKAKGQQPAADTDSDAKIFTVVLHPTGLSDYRGLLIEASTVMLDSRGTSKKAQAAAAKESSTPMSAYPPTPLSSVTPTPVSGKGQLPKRQRMRLDESNVHQFQAEVLKREEQALFLEPAADFADMQAIMTLLKHPQHDHEPPKHQSRKRTHAELEADELRAAEDERIALICDSRVNPSLTTGAAAAGQTEGHDASNAVDMTFNRFKHIEDIQRRHKEEQAAQVQEKHRQEMMRKDQEAQALAHKTQQQQQHHQTVNEQAKEEMMRKKREANIAAQAQQQTPQMRNNPNVMPPQAIQNMRMAAASQAQHSSPIMPNPNVGSSPLTHPNQRGGGVPMSASMSQQGVNSPRPGSASQMHQSFGQPMVRQTSQQQSHPSQSRTATPQMTNITPHLSNQHITPHMQQQHQGSPPMSMQQGPMPGMPNSMNAQQSPAAAHYMEQIKRKQMETNRAQAQRQGQPPQQNPMIHQMNQHQQAALRAHQMQQAAQQQGGHMPNGPSPEVQEQYRRMLANRHQQNQQQQQGQQNMPNMTLGTSSMPFPSNLATANNMGRLPSQQQFQQQGNMQPPQMQTSPPGSANSQQHQQQFHGQFPGNNPQLAQSQRNAQLQMSQLQERKQQALQNVLSKRDQFIQNLRNKNAGQVPPDAEQQFQRWVAAATQRINQGTQMQPGQPQQNMSMRQGMVAQQQGQGQGQNFNPQMSPQQNMGMNMQGNMPANMPSNMNGQQPMGNNANYVQALQGLQGQHRQAMARRLQEQQQQAQMRSINGQMGMQAGMQQQGMQGMQGRGGA